ncbi:MAG: hypothetical protein HYZ27_02670, partial [Deltaproteobacteria bacterium]|nr:hypothetical protein [Deltaproteobacteria bacterium]
DNDGDGLRDCADLMDCSGAGNLCGTGTSEAAACTDGLDNDRNGDRDCEDAACDQASCGTGCTCRAGAKAETACADAVDNDGDGLTNCADPDCSNVGAESSCGNGADDNCNGLVDSADTACGSDPACMSLALGKPCSANGQCASGRCFTESGSRWPSGACVGAANGCALDAGVSWGCPSGAVCMADGFGRFCRQACSGSGSSACRPGYACHEVPEVDGPRWCHPLCASDADCERRGGSYGCNLWSRLCETKDKQGARYGAACSAASQCESGVCLPDEGGYCAGLCRKGASCGPDGVCDGDDTSDQTGRCFDACASQADCTRGGDYLCKPAPYRATTAT